MDVSQYYRAFGNIEKLSGKTSGRFNILAWYKSLAWAMTQVKRSVCKGSEERQQSPSRDSIPQGKVW